MHIRAVYHSVGVAEALPESLPGGDLPDLVLVDCVVHHQVIGKDRAAARLVADAQSIEGMKGVGAKLDAGANFADFRGLFKHLDLEALAHQRQGRGQSADATARHQDLRVGWSVVHCGH